MHHWVMPIYNACLRRRVAAAAALWRTQVAHSAMAWSVIGLAMAKRNALHICILNT